MGRRGRVRRTKTSGLCSVVGKARMRPILLQYYLLLLLLSFIFLFLLLVEQAYSQKIVKTLPGYHDGDLPFKLETGYISVGEREEIQVFYYFVESQGNPRVNPLFLWHSGGPGCSSFSGLVYEIGPLTFDLENFDGNLPSLLLRKHDWTKLASIIFIDSPAGAGYSYDNTTKGYHASDTRTSMINYEFLRKWMVSHPSFVNNPLYITGDSYGGKIAVQVAYRVAKGIVQGHQPRLAFQGYIIGNSIDDKRNMCNERIKFAHKMALVSDQHFELANRACNGEFFEPEPRNAVCIRALRTIQKCVDPVNDQHILEPKCDFAAPRCVDKLRTDSSCWGFLENDENEPPVNFISMPKQEGSSSSWCRNKNHVPSYVWANDEAVRAALGVRNDTVSYWRRCNLDLVAAYIEDIPILHKMHLFLAYQGYRSLVYSGDHDLSMPYTSTLHWIRRLNLSVIEEWRPWNVNGQVAGYTETYKKGEAPLMTFATVKGAGHTAPEYKPEECYAMLERWLSKSPL